MILLLADANVEGHVQRLFSLIQHGEWAEFWDYLDARILKLQDVGLLPSSSDGEVWHVCQRQQAILLTNNRNDEGPESLEATIRSHTTPSSLPVFTFGDAEEILRDPAYAERVVEALLDNLLRLGSMRGVGRVWLP
ncbi:MAG: hypothetical protein WD066_09080 [Planctomycetaceae bacterium]